MAELARGRIADRPWGRTLGALGMRGLTGQLTLIAEGKQYCVAFTNGAIVGASSPLANDAGVRVALTGHLVTSTQVAEITRRLAQFPDRDEVSVIAEQAKLTSEQAQKLRRRLVAQRAARTFSIERGEFVVEDSITVPVVPGNELDIRAVIYLGARTNLSEARLASEIAQIGGYFKMKPEASEDLPQYGFSDGERPMLAQLASGASIFDLESAQADLTVHGVHAVIYALVSCNACDVGPAPAITPSRTQTPTKPAISRAQTPTGNRSQTVSNPAISRTQTPSTGTASNPGIRPPTADGRDQTPTNSQQPPPRGYSVTAAPTELRRMPTAPIEDTPSTRSDPGSSSPSLPRANTNERSVMTRGSTDPGASSSGLRSTGTAPPAIARTSSPNDVKSNSGSRPGIPGRAATPVGGVAKPPDAELVRMRPPSGPPANAPAAARGKRNDPALKETETLIAEKVALLDKSSDHYALLGVAAAATAEDIRSAYFALARKLHPDRLASLGIADEQRDAQRLFAQINLAFAVLSNPAQRADYGKVLSRGGEAAVKAEEAKIEDLTMRVMRAEEAFRRGEMALRRDQLTQAIADFQEASELQPKEAEYQALLAWAKFAAAPDKMAVASATRAALLKADNDSTKSVAARFYLGRVERMLGREKEALNHFQEVLRVKPNHAEASSEVRVLESRLKGKR
ncbi:MAG: heat shock protein DnaJ domain protein [Myxococcales bacterium]|nr:heat shock protein DnaJ domain protein [Myxococcales bacterium]